MRIKLIKTLLVAAGTVLINFVILSIILLCMTKYATNWLAIIATFFGLFQLLIFVPLAIVVRRRSHRDRMIRFWGILLGSSLIVLLNVLILWGLSTSTTL